MKKKIIMAGIVCWRLTTLGGNQDSITLPWKDFKNLYREHIQQELKEKVQKKKEKSVICIDNSSYALEIKEGFAEIDAVISGTIIKGNPEKIRLFGNDAVISKINKLSGVKLFNKDNQVFALPENQAKDNKFNIELKLLLPAQEDYRSSFVSIKLPSSLQNSLTLKLPKGYRLYEKPGLESKNNHFHLSSKDELTVRFKRKSKEAKGQLAEIDMFTEIQLQRRRLLFNVFMTPERNSSRKFILKSQKGSRFISSSLKRSWIKVVTDNEIEISLPENWKRNFNVQFMFECQGKTEKFTMELPWIASNSGREGDFYVNEPDSADIEISGKNLAKGYPASSLNSSLKSDLKKIKEYMSNPEKTPVIINVKRLGVIKAPVVVLDSVFFYSAFSENGNILSVIKFDMPAVSGRRLYFKKVPNAEIWYLKVNGKSEKVYTLDDRHWIIPLSENDASRIELAFLRKGKKMGIHGRLDSILSATGLTARKLYYVVCLPKKLEVISADGGVTPTEEKHCPPAKGLVGKPYFFYRSFYKGEEVKLALDYREKI